MSVDLKNWKDVMVLGSVSPLMKWTTDKPTKPGWYRIYTIPGKEPELDCVGGDYMSEEEKKKGKEKQKPKLPEQQPPPVTAIAIERKIKIIGNGEELDIPEDGMKITEITCNYCKKDLSEPGTYHLALSSGLLLLDNVQIQTAIMGYPLIEEDHHFCGFPCLRGWVATKG